MLRDWTDSLKMDGLSAEAERLFVRLIMKADDYGRFHAEPRLLKAHCFPLIDNLRPPDIARWLDELSTRQLILRYEADGRSCLAIINYGQRLKNSRAKFPPLPGESGDWLPVSEYFPELPGTSRNFPAEENRREVEAEENRKELPPPTPPKPAGGLASLPEVESSGRRFPDHAALCARINAIRPEWGRPSQWTAAEMHALHGSLGAFHEMDDGDWQLLGAFMRAVLPQAAGYWQPRNRVKFVETFPEVFASAQRWAEKSGNVPKLKPNHTLGGAYK